MIGYFAKAGTSEGAIRAWESRQRVAGGKIHVLSAPGNLLNDAKTHRTNLLRIAVSGKMSPASYADHRLKAQGLMNRLLSHVEFAGQEAATLSGAKPLVDSAAQNFQQAHEASPQLRAHYLSAAVGAIHDAEARLSAIPAGKPKTAIPSKSMYFPGVVKEDSNMDQKKVDELRREVVRMVTSGEKTKKSVYFPNMNKAGTSAGASLAWESRRRAEGKRDELGVKLVPVDPKKLQAQAKREGAALPGQRAHIQDLVGQAIRAQAEAKKPGEVKPVPVPPALGRGEVRLPGLPKKAEEAFIAEGKREAAREAAEAAKPAAPRPPVALPGGTEVPGELHDLATKVVRWANTATGASAGAAGAYAGSLLRDPMSSESAHAVHVQLLYIRSNMAGWKGPEGRAARQEMDQHIKDFEAKADKSADGDASDLFRTAMPKWVSPCSRVAAPNPKSKRPM